MGLSRLTDREIIFDAQKNNNLKNATERLYLKYFLGLSGFLKKYTSCEKEREDIIHDTFIKVIKNISNYDSFYPCAKSWIYGIAKNHLIDKKRREKLKLKRWGIKSSIQEAFESNYLKNHENPEKLLIKKEKKEILENIVKKLSNRSLEVFSLRHWKGLKYKEIGEKLNISEDNVKQILWRSKQKILKEMRNFYK